MAVINYATLDDLGAYLGSEPPAGSQALLARAQDLVDAALISSLFQIDNDTDGNPTDPVVLAALKKAVCAQVKFWIANGDELDGLGNWTSYSVAGVSVTRDPQGFQRLSRLCAQANDAMRRAKLLPGWISVP